VSFLAAPERRIAIGAAAIIIVLLGGWWFVRAKTSAATASFSASTGVDQPQPARQPSTEIPSLPPVAPEPKQPVRGNAPSLAPQITFTAVPNSIPQGATTRLRWHFTNAKSARIVPAPGVLRQTSGEFPVAPIQTTTYTLTAASKDGTVATATATVQVTPSAQPTYSVMVHHDHGVPSTVWMQCWGQLLVSGNHLQYRVSGSDDGRRDDFNVPLSQLQDVRMNRMLIRNLPAFHVTINGRVFNFIPQGTTAPQAVFAIQQRIGAR
jgi:hypothetical protein